MNIPSVFRELFIRCGEAWDTGCVPLRACLIELSSSWRELELSDGCPVSFTGEEFASHEMQFKEYDEWHKAREFAKEYLGTDDEGWIPPEANFAEICAQNKELFNLFLDRTAGEKSPEEARKMWPFIEQL